MKKLIKILFVFGVFLSFAKSSYAKTSEIVLGDQIPGITLHVKTIDENYKKGIYKLVKKDTGELVYCIEPGVLLKNGQYESYNAPGELEDINLTEEEWEHIKRITYYGYGYKDQNSIEWYITTQVAIWRYILRDKGRVEFSEIVNSSVQANINDCFNKLELYLSKHDEKPYFLFEKYDENRFSFYASAKKETVIKGDFNLEKYTIEAINSDVTFRVAGNNFYFTAQKPGYKLLRFYRAKGERGQIFYHAGSQTVVSRNNYFEPLLCRVNVSIPEINFVKTTDVPSRLSMEGGQYGVYFPSGAFFRRVKTDKNGKIIFNDFPYGQYFLIEEKAPYGTEKREDRFYFITDPLNTTITYENRVILKNISLEKYTSDNDIIDIEPNAEFELYYAKDDSLISTITLDEYGKSSFKLEYGKYYLKQTINKEGYVPTLKYEFEVNENSPSLIRIILEDPKITGNLTILKKDNATSNLIMNEAKFKIKNLDNNSYLNINNEEVFTTNNGKVSLNSIPYGNYEIEEITAPIGYLKGENQNFAIKNNNEMIEIDIYNEEIKGHLNLLKLDSLTKKTLSGVSFKIKNLDKNEYLKVDNIEIFTTDFEGKINIQNIPYGNYEIEEIEALPNYLKGENVTFQILNNDESQDITIYNEKETGSLALLKLDSLTKEPLDSVKFALYNSEGNIYQEFETNEEGKVSLESIPVGDYILKEIAALDGYELSLEEIPLIIKKGICSNITLTNRQKLENVPKTSTKEFLIALLLSSGMIGVGSLINYINRKKNEKNRN